MAKFYSSFFLLLLFFSPALYAQNVGIGTSTPREKLEVAGAILIGNTTGANAGSIRYNTATNKFEGCDNTGVWKEFGGGSGTDDWTKVGEAPSPTDADDIFHSGNVGIGTTLPLTKLHVKGNGNVAIKAETSNSNDTIPAINAINTIGIAVKATTSSTTKPAFYAYSRDGLAFKAESNADTMPAVWIFSDSSIAIKGQTKNKDWWAVEALNKDSLGYGLKAWNAKSVNAQGNPKEGGNAALFIGDVNLKGALRNTSNLYGGSIAVNDGMTVGNIAGSSCLASTSTTISFSKTIGGFLYFSGNSPTYSNIGHNNPSTPAPAVVFSPTTYSGQCRSVTNFSYESTFFDFEGFPINVDLYVRGQYMGSVVVADAKLSNNPPVPGNPPLVSWWSGDGGYYSKWTFSSSYWNGSDPKNVNWYVQCINHGSDTDYWESYKGTISYKWGDSTAAPLYAAFGEVRASGTLYANSINPYGDVAEYFQVVQTSRQPEAGDIVSISRYNSHTFVLTSIPYDPLLAGVISENPSLLVNSPNEGEPIALTGRVKVKVNLEGGIIKEGDAITSSSMEGVGMKASGEGMILGHALESFDGSRTDVGKIWMLISRTNISGVAGTKIVQGKNFNLGGVMISGAQKVNRSETSVFVEWDAQIKNNIPTDVEFDDLVIDVIPFGGRAELVVSKVNKDGFEVSAISKSEGFEGFYYKAEIVSPHLYTNGVTPVSNLTREELIAAAKKLYSQWNMTAEQLTKLSGKTLNDMPTGMNAEQIKKFKDSVMESWQKADVKLYEQYRLLQSRLGAAINGDPSVMRKLREN
ncbi:MAG TPA: hypothetical protein VNJ07_07810 [Chitinophagales bacterium]|nr:hypothetical protein [Chitinophagales bacterium]